MYTASTHPLTAPAACADCVYDDPSGTSPHAGNFAAAAAALCQPATRVLVTFETRTKKLRVAFLEAVKLRFTNVTLVSQQDIPDKYRVPHIELYELQL